MNAEQTVVTDDLAIPAELKRVDKPNKGQDTAKKEVVQVKEDFPAGEAITVH